MNQQTLFAKPPASRGSDPSSSHAAEAEVTNSGQRASQQHKVLAWVKRWPGLTSRELAARANVDRYIIARRLPDLATANLVKRGPMRPCGITHKRAVTWAPIEGKCTCAIHPDRRSLNRQCPTHGDAAEARRREGSA